MKRLMKITVLAAFFAASLNVLAQTPEPVYSVIRQIRDFDWYEQQAKAWKHEIDNGTTNPKAWVYWYQANRMAANFCGEREKFNSKTGDYFVSSNDIILKSAEKHIPNTIEYYYIKTNDSNGTPEEQKEDLIKAQKIKPFDKLMLPILLCDFVKENDKANIRLTCQKWFESNEMPQELLITMYNMLISLEQNAILLVNGDNDTFPCWVLQEAKNIRPDVLIVNISFAQGKKYRENIFKENDIKPFVYENDSLAYITAPQLIEHLIANKGNRPLYVSQYVGSDVYKKYEDNMYFTGLALKYSPKPFNNLAVLRDNVENKFLLDFLKEDFQTTYAQSVVDIMKASYLSSFQQLYNYYKQTGEKDKAKKIKELSVTIAENTNKTEWLDYFDK